VAALSALLVHIWSTSRATRDRGLSGLIVVNALLVSQRDY